MDTVIVSFERGIDGRRGCVTIYLLLVKDMSEFRLIPQAPNSQKLNINVVHLVGFDRFCRKPKTKFFLKKLATVPPIPTKHDLSFQKSVKTKTIF